jgi:hypothetical protein
MVKETKLVKLPLSVWQAAKHAAIDKNQSLSQWIADAIGLRLNSEKEAKKLGGQKE